MGPAARRYRSIAAAGVRRANAGSATLSAYVDSSTQSCSSCLDKIYTRSGARFTKYLTTILRLSYDNGKVTIDLRRTSNLQNILQ